MMMIAPRRNVLVCFAAMLVLVALGSAAPADASRQVLAPAEHPLMPALRLAYDVRAHIVREVKDYSCVLIKRERVDGQLLGHQYLFAKIRHEQVRAGRVVTPFSVYLHFLSPLRLRGREVLYVKGQNDGKLIARKGGPRFSYVTVSLDPLNESAMKGNRYPITEIGIQNLVERLIEVGHEEMKQDPASQHCEVKFFDQAKVCGRECFSIRIGYPEEEREQRFHFVRIYVDKELRVPIRYEAYDFPEVAGGAAKLLEEYTYRDLKLNIGLTDEDFQRSRFGSLVP
ncbi:MAG: hypothetical protein A2W31_16045 [Planctomycetes bacterium RBG_16_64_10]|nr:MAG: hypothetical protein A2W31_16045 [Planctomycetes bacterium RBG_16_64_10]